MTFDMRVYNHALSYTINDMIFARNIRRLRSHCYVLSAIMTSFSGLLSVLLGIGVRGANLVMGLCPGRLPSAHLVLGVIT